MDVFNKNLRNRYDRVMPRVSNQSRSALKSSSFVTRHDIPSSVRVGAKQSVSNVSSSVFSELPTVLNDFIPESSSKKVSRTFVVKPRKTIKSLDPAKSPTVAKSKQFGKRPLNVRAPDSAPSVLRTAGEQWSETHYKQCLTSRSHSRLKELKSEIRAYHETDKLMRIRSNLFKKCGVVLDDVGNLAADKAVQVEEVAPVAHDSPPADIRCKLWIAACGRDDLIGMSPESLRHKHICALHFTKRMYGKQHLKKTSIPVLNLPTTDQGTADDGPPIKNSTTVRNKKLQQKRSLTKTRLLESEKLKLSNEENDITEEQFLKGCDKFLSPQLSLIVKTHLSLKKERPSPDHE